MKRLICFMLVVLLLIGLTGCHSNGYSGDEYSSASGTVVDNGEYNNDSDNDYSNENEADVNNNYDTNNSVDYETDSTVEYISSRSVQFDQHKNIYTLFFGFKNISETFIDASGTASVLIADNNGRQLFKKDIKFTENNFSQWEKSTWTTSRYLCSLDIDASNFPHSDSSYGTLTLSVTLDDGTYFNEHNLTIYDLPEHDWKSATCTTPKTCSGCGETSGSATGHNYYSGTCTSCGAQNPQQEAALAQCSLKLPTLPYTLKEYDYDDNVEYTFQVTDISYKFTVEDSGYVSLDLWFSGNKNYDIDGAGQSDVCMISYKIYDSDNNVVESDTVYSPAVAMGEKFSNQRAYVYWGDQKPGAFRLEILDTNHR